MGLSPGWADPYPWILPDQRLLLTGLDDGVYRLWAAADPGSWFREANETNNATWVDLRLRLDSDAAARRGRTPRRVRRPDVGRVLTRPQLPLAPCVTDTPLDAGTCRWSPIAEATQIAAPRRAPPAPRARSP